MPSVVDIFEQLESVGGRLEKEAILEANKKNKLLQRAFAAALDPYTVYYVNKFKPGPVNKSLASHELDDDDFLASFLDLIAQSLATRKLTGNAARDALSVEFANMDSERVQKWCLRILLRNLRCGVQESTLNKVWPGLVKSFAVALADTLKSEFIEGKGIKLLAPVTYPVRVEPKLDGLRCIAVKQSGEVTFYTRNGSVLETLPQIKAILEGMSVDDVVLDCEAMGKDWNESASVLMAKKTHKDDSNIVLNVFDVMPLADWKAQECNIPYYKRNEIVVSVIDAIANDSKVHGRVQQVPHIMAKNEKELLAYFQECMDKGFEGVMLKTLDTPYKFKRSSNILKLKPCVTYEGVIVGDYEGRTGTKREGQFGGFVIELPPNGVCTRVGGGFNDALRAEIQLAGAATYTGKIIEIEAQPDPLTPDGLTVDGRARFPVFVRFRSEKDVSVAMAARAKEVQSQSKS